MMMPYHLSILSAVFLGFCWQLAVGLLFQWLSVWATSGWATSHHHHLAESATKECTEIRQAELNMSLKQAVEQTGS